MFYCMLSSQKQKQAKFELDNMIPWEKKKKTGREVNIITEAESK